VCYVDVLSFPYWLARLKNPFPCKQVGVQKIKPYKFKKAVVKATKMEPKKNLANEKTKVLNPSFKSSAFVIKN
jgi:hypothetical protein